MPFGMRLIGTISLATMPMFTRHVCAARLLRTWLGAPILSAAPPAFLAWAAPVAREAPRRNETVGSGRERTIPLPAASVIRLLFDFMV